VEHARWPESTLDENLVKSCQIQSRRWVARREWRVVGIDRWTGEGAEILPGADISGHFRTQPPTGAAKSRIHSFPGEQ